MLREKLVNQDPVSDSTVPQKCEGVSTFTDKKKEFITTRSACGLGLGEITGHQPGVGAHLGIPGTQEAEANLSN